MAETVITKANTAKEQPITIPLSFDATDCTHSNTVNSPVSVYNIRRCTTHTIHARLVHVYSDATCGNVTY